MLCEIEVFMGRNKPHKYLDFAVLTAIKPMKIIKKSYGVDYYENILYQESANSPRNLRRLRELKRFKSEGVLLEIGCGMGHLLSLAQEHFTVSGIDISFYAVSNAKKFVGPRVQVADIEALPLLDNHFDAVLAYNVFEHLSAPQQSIESLYRTLKPGGILIGSVPNNYGLVGGVATKIMNWFDRTHVSTYPTFQWRRIFEEIGFSQIELFGEVTLGRNRCVYIKKPLWKNLSFNLVFVCQK